MAGSGSCPPNGAPMRAQFSLSPPGHASAFPGVAVTMPASAIAAAATRAKKGFLFMGPDHMDSTLNAA
jgi:hypothetical protein